MWIYFWECCEENKLPNTQKSLFERIYKEKRTIVLIR